MTESSKKPTHTPGPWEVDTICNTDMVYAANGLRVATTYCEGQDEDMPWEEVEANARLVAAAPDLLAGLEAAEAIISGLMAEFDEDENDVPSIIGIRAAIAKAKGEEPVNA